MNRRTLLSSLAALACAPFAGWGKKKPKVGRSRGLPFETFEYQDDIIAAIRREFPRTEFNLPICNGGSPQFFTPEET